MAYSFTAASSQYLSVASVPVSTYSVTLYARVKTSTTGTSKAALTVTNTSNSDYFLSSGLTTSDVFAISQRNGVGVTTTVSTGSTSTADNIWHDLTGKFSASNSIAVYTDGISAAAGTTDISAFPSSLNTFSIGALVRTTTVNYMNGQLAEAAIWSAALTDAEITSLYKGFKPQRIRPQSLVFYAPLIRDLQDTRGGLTITNNNSATVADHPRVY